MVEAIWWAAQVAVLAVAAAVVTRRVERALDRAASRLGGDPLLGRRVRRRGWLLPGPVGEVTAVYLAGDGVVHASVVWEGDTAPHEERLDTLEFLTGEEGRR